MTDGLPFISGNTYSRQDVYEILSVPPAQRRGNWETGYTRWGDDLFIFCTVGSAATGGFDYDNGWEGERLRWYAKNDTHLDQPLIQWILKDAQRIFLFTRVAIRTDFTFEGLAYPAEWFAESPVRITWEVDRSPYAPRRTKGYIFTWDQAQWDWENYDDKVELTRSGESVSEWWSTGSTKTIPVGSRVFLLRQVSNRGLVGSGLTTSPVTEGAHWQEGGGAKLQADVQWNVLLGSSDHIPTEELIALIPEINWNSLRGSGTSVPAYVMPKLESLWREHTRSHRRRIFPDEVAASDATYVEGAVKQVLVNAYERNPEARAACISNYGAVCQVCGLDFSKMYGPIGLGFIHVHHLVPLSAMQQETVVDPIKDLRPVCPNCHAMLHRENPPLPIEALQALILNAQAFAASIR